VFHLDDRPLTSMMLPRSDINGWTPAPRWRVPAQGGQDGERRRHSWYPVCRGSLDDVVGKISVGTLLQPGAGTPAASSRMSQSAVFVPETLTGMELLEQFRAKSTRMVLVVDEYGVVQGLITPNDLLEAITGELQPMPGRRLGHAARRWLLAGGRR
jgi:putative hemolysin